MAAFRAHPESIRFTDSQISIRVSAVQEAVKRNRLALLLCVMSAFAIALSVWNTYLGWDRTFAFEAFPAVNIIHPISAADTGRKERSTEEAKEIARSRAVEHAIRSWVEAQQLTVNLLGIKISSSDMPTLGTAALFFFSFYYLLCSRRENKEIGQLFRDLHREMNTIGYTALRAVNSYMVFSLSDHADDRPIDQVAPSVGARKQFAALRPTSKALNFLPAIVVVTTIGIDVLTIFCDLSSWTLFRSPFRSSGGTLWTRMAPDEQVFVCVQEVIAIALLYAIVMMTQHIERYQHATLSVLDDYRSRLDAAGVLRNVEPGVEQAS